MNYKYDFISWSAVHEKLHKIKENNNTWTLDMFCYGFLYSLLLIEVQGKAPHMQTTQKNDTVQSRVILFVTY